MTGDFGENKKKKTEYSNTERAQLFILCDVKLKQEATLL